MKNLIAVVVILSLSASLCFAGAYVPTPSISAVLKDQSLPPDETYLETEPIVIEKVLKVVPEQPEPATGSALGFYNSIPTLLIDNRYLPIELGLQLAPAGSTGLARIDTNLLMFNQGYTRSHIGALAIINSQAPSTLGVFLGIEQYLHRNVSLNLDLYPALYQTGLIVGQAIIGGRFYF